MNLHNHITIISYYFLTLFCFCNANIILENGCMFKGMFIFGSSVVDSGNNKDLNYLPYGIDFVNGHTGRASNGKTVTDCIGDYLQLPFIPSFESAQTNGDPIIDGVNFAYGGSGILNETGAQNGVISLHEQITNLIEVTLPDLESQMNCTRKKLLPNYLFLLGAGNNDYIYYLISETPSESPQAFARRITSIYYAQLKRLYEEGARNFLLLSAYPVGCSPVITQGGECLTEMNAIITMFYDQLLIMINQFQSVMPGSKFIVLNSVKAITSILSNPDSSGFNNVREPCCEASITGTCKVNGTPCNNRNGYAFFDGHHNTEAFANVVASKIYYSVDSTEVYPVNLQKFCNKLPIKSS